MKKITKLSAMMIIAILFFATGCKKEVDLIQPKVEVKKETSTTIENQKEFKCPVLENPKLTNEGMAVNKGNNSSATPVEKYLYLDFDGEFLSATVWNTNGPYTFPAAGYTNQQKDSIVLYVQRLLKPWNIKVGRNRIVYNNTPVNEKMMCIITPSSVHYFGINWTGVAYISSWYWLTNPATPFFVFNGNFNSLYQLARCIYHEFGHTLGCYHQAIYDNGCNLVFEYHPMEGFGDLSWCTPMGNPYQGNICTPMTGTPYISGGNSGCTQPQNDPEKFDDALGRRMDDFANQISGTIALSRNVSKDFTTETDVDVDFFKTTGANPWVKVSSYNLDYMIRVYDKNGVLIQTVDPEDIRGANFKINISGSNSNAYYIEIVVSPNPPFMLSSSIKVGTGSIKVTAQQAP